MRLSAPITTKRLFLDTLEESDATPRYVNWLTNPAINRYLESRRAAHTLECVRSFIRATNESTSELLLGMRDRARGEHIGNIKIGPIDRFHAHAAIGLVLDPASWGKGLATEAIVALTTYAFEDLQLEKVYAGCYATNLGSIRAFEKAGFLREAQLASHWRDDEEGRVDGILLGKVRSQASRQSSGQLR